MKLIKHLPIYTVAIIVLSITGMSIGLSSCSKGDTGPAGPIGAQGDSGVNGVSNIISSTFTVTSSSWVSTGVPNYHWAANFINTNVTANNVDAVEAYWCTSLGSGWSPLPVSSLINPGDEMSFRYNDDSTSFTYYTGGTDVQPPSFYTTPNNYSTIIFKVTVIPPSIQVKYPGTNWQNAAEVALLPEVRAALNAKTQ